MHTKRAIVRLFFYTMTLKYLNQTRESFERDQAALLVSVEDLCLAAGILKSRQSEVQKQLNEGISPVSYRKVSECLSVIETALRVISDNQAGSLLSQSAASFK